MRVLTGYGLSRLQAGPQSKQAHLILSVADHFEPSIVPHDGLARVPLDEQERRLERWCSLYPKIFDTWRDHDGRPFVHTYFYPAEQYDRGLIQRLSEHCHAGWGEIEVHLHHGWQRPDTAADTRRVLTEFRDALALEHGCLSYREGEEPPQYAFVHGNFALANSSGGHACGVDEEMQLLAETGCYVDMTLPPGIFHPAQTTKINSVYECGLPLHERAPHRRGKDLAVGRAPKIFPLILQGPLVVELGGGRRMMEIENSALTAGNPPSVRRVQLWRKAAVAVRGREEWVLVKLHCHGMDPTQEDAILGGTMQRFLTELMEGAEARGETLHFVTAREMVNIALAACDGREGNPGDYRDYRLKQSQGRKKQQPGIPVPATARS
jgi:hypothetical protein